MGDDHAHSLAEVVQLLPYTENCVHVPNVDEVVFTPGLGRETIMNIIQIKHGMIYNNYHI